MREARDGNGAGGRGPPRGPGYAGAPRRPGLRRRGRGSLLLRPGYGPPSRETRTGRGFPRCAATAGAAAGGRRPRKDDALGPAADARRRGLRLQRGPLPTQMASGRSVPCPASDLLSPLVKWRLRQHSPQRDSCSALGRVPGTPISEGSWRSGTKKIGS
ncbi:unnamed protein product [Nyctereutes procyonoides]|uniref:(raccoon dog) hypothetical protein n=1 Tax=Nyctereutes procyonoides TaxID=34880 RepID=A0A811YB74_NYCPR|nr:unnamed protein product [Nyctereutes procyonoides]